MTLNNTLKTGKTEGAEAVTFYHVSTEVDAFKSFFREGAKAIGEGLGGQQDGFYVWSNKKAAEEHLHFLIEDPFSNKNLKNNEAVIIGVDVLKSSISYPTWQQDYECSKGLFNLCTAYGDFFNEKAHALNIPILKDNLPLGWNFEKITDIVFNKEGNYLLFEGPDSTGKKWRKRFYNSDFWDSDDSFKFQILTDWLCENNSDFKKDYDNLMQRMIHTDERVGLKYTGPEPLPITFAQFIKINKDGAFKKTTLFDAKKGCGQVCPFLTLATTQARKEK